MTDSNDRLQKLMADEGGSGARPDSVSELIASMTPEIYENLRSAVELGKWQDGSRLTAQQLEHCMEAVILYEARNLPPAQRTGAPLANDCASATDSATQPLFFTDEKH